MTETEIRQVITRLEALRDERRDVTREGSPAIRDNWRGAFLTRIDVAREALTALIIAGTVYGVDGFGEPVPGEPSDRNLADGLAQIADQWQGLSDESRALLEAAADRLGREA